MCCGWHPERLNGWCCCCCCLCCCAAWTVQVQDMYASALADDPNAFEYDSVYDSMQEQKAAPKQKEKLARRPKYIASLLEQAEVRKKEQGITFERMLVGQAEVTVAGCAGLHVAWRGAAGCIDCAECRVQCAVMLWHWQAKTGGWQCVAPCQGFANNEGMRLLPCINTA